jgi:hypothetical protein
MGTLWEQVLMIDFNIIDYLFPCSHHFIRALRARDERDGRARKSYFPL